MNDRQPKLPLKINALLFDSSRRLWVGNRDGVGYLTNGVYHPLTSPPDWQLEPPFLAERSRDAAMFIGNESRLYVIVPGTEQLNRLLTLPENARITSLYSDHTNRLWIGTARAGLYVFADSRLRHLPLQPEVTRGSIVGLIEDEGGELWFGCNRNVVSVNANELWHSAKETNSPPARTQIFNQRDGLGPVDFTDSFQPLSHRDSTGRIWFAMLRGVGMVEPRRSATPATISPVRLESFSYFDPKRQRVIELNLTASNPAVVLPPDSGRVQIRCALLEFGAAEKERYRFRLDGTTAQWEDNGNDRLVSLYQVSAGDHTLTIEAASENGEWTSRVELPFRVENFFWRTTWFWALCSSLLVIGTGLLTWWVASLRIRQARKLLEQERRLAELQARLGLVLENTSDFVGFTDAHGKLFYLNQAGRKIIGLAADAGLDNLDLKSLYPEHIRQQHAHLWQPSAERQAVWSGESVLLHRDGREIPVSQVVIAHRHADGTLDFTSSISRDISAAKRNERIRESLRSLASALTAPLKPQELGRTVARECRKVFEHDAFFFVTVDNTGGIQPHGFWEDTPYGKSEPETIHGDMKTPGPRLRQALAGKNILINTPGDISVSYDPSESFGVKDRPSASAMFAPIVWEGQTIGALSVQSYRKFAYGEEELTLFRSLADQCGPVVSRLLVEEQLRQNEERLRLATESAHIGSWEIMLPDSRLIATEQAEKIYGFALGKMSGDPRRLVENIPLPDRATVSAQLEAILSGKNCVIECIHPIRLADGTERWLEIKGRIHGSGPDARAIGITADITARRQAELEKERLEKQLRQSNKLDALGRLAGGIAHDFNNILTSIMGYNDLSASDLPPNHSVQAYLKEVSRGAVRAKQLVAQILTFSSRREQQHVPLLLWPVVSEALNLLRSSLPAHIEIRSHNDAGIHSSILGDTAQIHQIIMNLGTNAGHAMRDIGGVLDVRLEALHQDQPWRMDGHDLAAGNYFRLTVADNGTGMPPEIQERIFEPFFSTKNPTEGTGLGLSVVHGILKNHRAEVRVRSELGKGTTFEIIFPAAGPAITTEASATAAPRGDGQHIMLVDDEEHILRLAARVLQRQGYRVTSFDRPQAAWEAFQSSPAQFDLLLTDLTMPGMNGVELTRKIRNIRASLPVILSTGFAALAGGKNVTDELIQFRLDKPYEPRQLVTIVAQALGKASMVN